MRSAASRRDMSPRAVTTGLRKRLRSGSLGLPRARPRRVMTPSKCPNSLVTMNPWCFEHHGFIVTNELGHLLGVITRRGLARGNPNEPLLSLLRSPVVTALGDMSLREAADLMVQHNIGRLPVVTRAAPNI